mgnify:CR=1 FL=1
MTLPLIAEVGETVGLGLPLDSLMVSTENPGRNDALLTLPATAVEGEGGLALDIFGQRIVLARGGPHAIGAPLWVSAARILPRPEPSDSADNRR